MKLINFNINKKRRILWILIILTAFWSCNQDEELKYTLQSKQVIFTQNGDSIYLLGGLGVNQLDLLKVAILAKDIKNNSGPSEIKISSIPNDGNGPLPEIQLEGINNDGEFTSSLPAIGIQSQNYRATLKFVSKFNDGEEITRTFQVKPVSPFNYTAPVSVFALIDNVSLIAYTINSGNASVDGIKVRKKVNEGTVSEVAGNWGVTGGIPVQGKEYQVGDNVFYQIEVTNENAIATSDWIKIPVLKPEGKYTYLFEMFFGGTPAKGFTDGCWAGAQGNKSFINTVFNYEGASGGSGAFDKNGWNTLYTHVVGSTPIVAYSGLMTANYSSTTAAVGQNKDLLTPQFDASNTKNNKLEFYYLCKASEDKVNHLKVFATTDNVNWTELGDLAEQTTWGKQEFNLSSDVIRVKFTGISGGAGNVQFNTYIDDIKIYGEF